MLSIFASVLITALIVGASVFAYESNQKSDAEQNLQAQINTLQSNLVALKASPSPTVSPSVTPTTSPAVTASPTVSPTTTALSACASSNISAAVTNPEGTAGTVYYTLTLTNSGSVSCTLEGIPNVSLLDSNAKVLGSATGTTTVAASQITLAPSKSAYTNLGFPDAGNFPDGQCSAAAAKMSITPPNQTTPIIIANTSQYCPGFSVSALVATVQ